MDTPDGTGTAPIGATFVSVLLYSGVEAAGPGTCDSMGLVLAERRVGDGGFDDAMPGLPPSPDHS